MPASRKIKKIYYHKLIRDKVPDTMRNVPKEFAIRTLSRTEFRLELLRKVGEEASALPKLTKKEDIISEVGDVLDVLDEIRREYSIRPRELSLARLQAKKKKGGFQKRVFLIWSEKKKYKTNERRNRR